MPRKTLRKRWKYRPGSVLSDVIQDRNWNNANLLYNIVSSNLIAIDHGCIFNTATFDYKLSILTQSETILCSDLAYNIIGKISLDEQSYLFKKLKNNLFDIKRKETELKREIINCIPHNWNIDSEIVLSKMNELFDEKWIIECWNTFIEYYNENQNGETTV